MAFIKKRKWNRLDYANYNYDKNGNQNKVEKYSKNNAGTFELSIGNDSYKGNPGAEKFTYNGLNEFIGYENITGQ